MLRVKYYNLNSSLLNEKIRIVNITDVHSNVSHLKSALLYAKYIEADIITIPGDLFDSVDNPHNKEIVDTLKKVKDVEIYISNGNHDLVRIEGAGFFAKLYSDPNMKYYEALNEEKNIHVFLDNKNSFIFKRIDIISFDPGQVWYQEDKESKKKFDELFDEYLKKLDKTNRFRIMLLHSCNGLIVDNELPRRIEGVNLVLSGHNHCGLTPVIFQKLSKNNRGIIGPYNKILMKSCYGTWTKGNTSVILSDGLTKMGESHGSKLIRESINYLFKCDLDVIELEPSDSHQLKLISKKVQK